jgi:tetratricopeptide (TPR) repeat protein
MPSLTIAGRAALGLLAALALGGCADQQERKARALERGAAYIAAGNFEKARVELQTALQAAPEDPEVRFQNGRIQEKLGNVREAAGLYESALSVDPGHTRARAAFARVLVFGGAPERAMEILRPGLETNPDDAALLTVRAGARAGLGDVAGAVADAERAHRLDPKAVDSISVLAGLYSSTGRDADAGRVLVQGVRDQPANVELRLALLQWYTRQRDAANAEIQLRELARLRPEEGAHRIRLALFLSRDGRLDDAERVLRDARAALPRDADVRTALVSFLAGARGVEAARRELEAMVAAAPDDAELPMALAAFHAESGETERAEAVYRKVIADGAATPAGAAARTRLAMLLDARGDTAGAEAVLSDALERNPRDGDALALRASRQLARGDAQAAIADLRAVLRDRPNDLRLLRELARAHLANDEPALAEEALRRGAEAEPTDRSVRLELAQLLLRTGDVPGSMALLRQLVEERPADPAALDGLFRAALRADDLPTAKSAAEALLAVQPKAAIGHLYGGVVAEAEGRLDAAVDSYARAVEIEPESPEPIAALTAALVKGGRVKDALARLDALAARSSTSAVPLQLKGDILLGSQRPVEAEVAYRAAAQRAPAWWTPYRGVARAQAAQGERQAAEQTLRDAIPRVADPAAAGIELAQFLEAAGRRDAAIAAYEQVLERTPRNLVAVNNLAMLLVGPGADAASVARAATLVTPLASSSSPAILDTYGWVRLKSGDPRAAVAALERAVAAAPDVAEFRYHLGLAQLAAGQQDQARVSLERAIAKGGAFAGVDDAKAALAQLAEAPVPRVLP